MGKKIEVIIGAVRFATKKEAREYVAAMLERYANGERVVGDDDRFLRDLLDLHPDAAEKIGSGVSYFTREADGRGGRCFWLWRTDGTDTDWSTGKALKLTGPRHDLLDALRCEIEAQRNDFIRTEFADGAQPPCAITGEPLSQATAHVDHAAPTFAEIARGFLAEEGVDSRSSLPQVADASTRRYLADRDLAERWREFHRERAVLRLTTADANLRRKRGPRTPDRA